MSGEAKRKLTKSFVDALEPDLDPRKRRVVWDTEVSGFGLTVTPYTQRSDGSRGGGVKSYIVQYRPGGRGTPTRRVTIGRHGWEWQPESARKEAAEIIRLRRQGLDPFEERRRQRRAEDTAKGQALQDIVIAERFAYSSFCDEFIEQYAKPNQPGSWFQSERALKDLGKQLDTNCRVDTLTRDEIRNALKPLTTRSPSAGVAAHKAIRKLYTWANHEQILDWHPAREMKRPAQDTVRDRVLTSEELKAVWDAAALLGYPFGPMYMLILATGLRLRDVANAVWGEYQPGHEALIIPAKRMKRKPSDIRGAFLVPLNERALMVIEILLNLYGPSGKAPPASRPIFTANGNKPVSGFSAAKARLDKIIADDLRLKVAPWTTHDLRRTMSTAMQPLGVDTNIIDRMQDHRPKEQSKTALHYQHWDYIEEKRAAAAAYGEYLAGLIDGDKQFADIVAKVNYRLVLQ